MPSHAASFTQLRTAALQPAQAEAHVGAVRPQADATCAQTASHDGADEDGAVPSASDAGEDACVDDEHAATSRHDKTAKRDRRVEGEFIWRGREHETHQGG
jgi:hypothetical protein